MRTEETSNTKIKTLDHLDNQHIRTQLNHVCTERSSEKAVGKRGAGIQILMHPHKIKKSVAMAELSINNRAELQAVLGGNKDA